MTKCPACHNPLELCDCFTNTMESGALIEPNFNRAIRSYGKKQPPKEGIKKHGTNGYAFGCRCDVCRAEKTAYMRERKLREID